MSMFQMQMYGVDTLSPDIHEMFVELADVVTHYRPHYRPDTESVSCWHSTHVYNPSLFMLAALSSAMLSL